MRRLPARLAQAGQVLALPVTNDRGVAVVQKGVRLTESTVARLEEIGVRRIFVDEPGFMGVECREGLDPPVYSRLKGFLRDLAETVRSQGDDADLSPHAKSLYAWSQTICEQLENGSPSFLPYLPEGDPMDRWVAHVVNVSLLAARTLLSIGGQEQARHVAAAAFLQDLGLWRFGEDAVSEALAGPDDPSETLKKHVGVSQRFATTVPGLASYVKAVVAQHHERCDGTGYPQGKVKEAIHPLARVMAVTDTYVTVTQRERDPLLPHDALEMLMAGVGFEYDHAAVKAFRNAVHPYPVGTEVELETGEKGVVTGIKGALAARPCVRVLWDGEGRETDPYELDLSLETTKSIRRILQ